MSAHRYTRVHTSLTGSAACDRAARRPWLSRTPPWCRSRRTPAPGPGRATGTSLQSTAPWPWWCSAAPGFPGSPGVSGEGSAGPWILGVPPSRAKKRTQESWLPAPCSNCPTPTPKPRQNPGVLVSRSSAVIHYCLPPDSELRKDLRSLVCPALPSLTYKTLALPPAGTKPRCAGARPYPPADHTPHPELGYNPGVLVRSFPSNSLALTALLEAELRRPAPPAPSLLPSQRPAPSCSAAPWWTAG